MRHGFLAVGTAVVLLAPVLAAGQTWKPARTPWGHPDLQGTWDNHIERFTRLDPDTINYEVTFEDPTTWTKPWTAAIPWRKSQGRIFEYACHEGNYGMTGILNGGREEEKASR